MATRTDVRCELWFSQRNRQFHTLILPEPDRTWGDLAPGREIRLHFVSAGPDELGVHYRRTVESSPPEEVMFAWAGDAPFIAGRRR